MLIFFFCCDSRKIFQTVNVLTSVFLLIIILISKHVLLLFRPSDRRRRDVFDSPNGTFLYEGSGGNSSLWDNSTEGLPPVRLYPFSEDKVATESTEIPLLKPFTVYRVDLHACNEVVGRCSAGAFVYARTKPAGSIVTLRRRGSSLFQHRLRHGLFFFLQRGPTTSRGRWSTRWWTRRSAAWCCTGPSR